MVDFCLKGWKGLFSGKTKKREERGRGTFQGIGKSHKKAMNCE